MADRKQSQPCPRDASAGCRLARATTRLPVLDGPATCRAGSPSRGEEAMMDWHNVITIIVIIVQSARLV